MLIPASSYFESPLCREIIDELSDLFPERAIRIVGGDSSAEEFVLAKLQIYDEGGDQHSKYLTSFSGADPYPPYLRRYRSATEDIRTAWVDQASAPGFMDLQFGKAARLLPGGFLDSWHRVPDILGTRAFTPEYATKVLAKPTDHLGRVVDLRVNDFINAEYFRSYTVEYGAGLVTDLNALGSNIATDNRNGNLEYSKARDRLRDAQLLDAVRKATAMELIAMRDTHEIAMALLPCLGAGAGHVDPTGPAALLVEVDLSSAVRQLRGIPTGAKDATRYHKRVVAILDQVFAHSLNTGVMEDPKNEGRKRIDVTWINHATAGVFEWFGRYHHGSMVLGECKNYTADIANNELDQLIARFEPGRHQFGLFMCRKLKDRDLALKRCRDAHQSRQGLILLLVDDDIEALATMSRQPGWDKPQGKWLEARFREVTSGVPIRP